MQDSAHGRLEVLSTAHARYPLRCRPRTSDADVFRQMFVVRELSCLDDLEGAGLILDCGANVGYASAYLLSRFPGSEVIAVEPDLDNFRLLDLNLSPYASSATILRSAVWSHATRLTFTESPYRDGREWARQVRECRPGEEGFQAVDIGSLLAGSGHDRIFILKVDIEGAEGVVFAANYEAWIERVDNIVVELHDDSYFGDCTSIFSRAVAGRGFAVTRHQLLTLCRRNPPRPPHR
jgi:FkbM family methyltransferase